MLSFADAFRRAAAKDSLLRSLLLYQDVQRLVAGMDRIEAEMAAQRALSDQSIAPVRELNRRVAERQRGLAAGSTRQTEPSRYRYPTQQIVRYVTLGFGRSTEEGILKLIESLAVTRVNWVAESTDATPFVLCPEEFTLFLKKVDQLVQDVSTRRGARANAFVEALTQRVTLDLQHRVLESGREVQDELPAEAQAFRDMGIQYVTLGVAPEFVSLMELVRLLVRPVLGAVPQVTMGEREVHFESLEDFHEVLESYQLAFAKSGGNMQQLVANVTAAAIQRAAKKHLLFASPGQTSRRSRQPKSGRASRRQKR